MNDFASLFRNADAVARRPGDVLFEAGTPGTEMYVVRAGEVGIKLGDSIVERVAAGGIVGEMALIDNAPRSASAVVMADSEIIAVDQKRFLFLVQQTPFFALQVMRIMAERLRAMNRSAPPPSP